jgi:hypothetical protein
VKITREELFHRVWASPLRTLAKEFDISDVGLKKVCVKHQIPTPPQGYWARTSRDRAFPRQKLPGLGVTIITVDARQHRPQVPSVAQLEAVAGIKVSVANVVGDLTPTARRTFDALTKLKPSKEGFLRCGSSRTFSCSIGAGSVQRAVLILDAIERALPQIAAEIAVDKTGKRVVFRVNGENIGLLLSEEFKRSETLVKHPKHSYLDAREYHYVFSGNLRLTLEADYSGRKLWADGVRSKLEEKLPSFLVGLASGAAATIALRTEREASRLRWEEIARRDAAIAEERRQRLNFLEKFAKEADVWRQYQNAQAYLEHVLNGAKGLSEPLPDSSKAWITLATEMVSRMNPIDARLRLLQAGPAIDSWHGRFGQAVVG